jgi:hypothetical protein
MLLWIEIITIRIDSRWTTPSRKREYHVSHFEYYSVMAALSEYEAKRLRRMEENKRVLQSLDLPALHRPAARSPSPKIPAKTAEPVRRSGRVQTLKQKRRSLAGVKREAQELQEQRLALVEFERKKRRREEAQRKRQERVAQARTEKDWERHKQQHWKQQLRAMARLESKRQQELKRMVAVHPPQIDLPFVYACQLESTTRGASESAKRLNVQLDAFHEVCLGTQLLPEGKKTVMHALCPTNAVLFPALSGIQLWRNAMVLFVKDGDKTLFHQDQVDGRRLVYFEWLARRARHSVLPSTALRLRQVQKGDERLRIDEAYYDQGEGGEHEPLLLFLQHSKVRHELPPSSWVNRITKVFLCAFQFNVGCCPQGPYIYCGRLAYLGHRSSDPLEFRWQLLDVDSFDWRKVYAALASPTGSSSSSDAISP